MSSIAIMSEENAVHRTIAARKGSFMTLQNQDPAHDPEDRKPYEELRKQLTFSFKNLWNPGNQEEMNAVMAFCEDYKVALNEGKTEREFVKFAVDLLEKNGFCAFNPEEQLVAGDRVYDTVLGKGLVAAVVGSDSPVQGFNLIGAHIDSPRLDLKPNPLYESNDLAFLKTHYYGGIKKYLWVATPLALHGFVTLNDGTTIEISIGENEEDPVFSITDLLIHLAEEKMQKKASDVVSGEELNVLVGGIPITSDEDVKERFKLGILKLLHDQYGIVERNLLTAEIEIVPAVKARDIGFDRAFVGGYGQDDRVCAYTALRALIDIDQPLRRTAMCLFYDKEEIGSTGVTGARSQLYPSVQKRIVRSILGREPSAFELIDNIEQSVMLSSDVAAAYDPTYPTMFDPLNSTYAGRGIAIVKYVGHGGKSHTSDASAEYFDEVTKLLDKNSIPWQTGELGRIDLGGGGTVAVFQADLGMTVIDCGVPVLSMHSCFEATSKIDIYTTYRAYSVFFEQMRVED